MAKNDGVEGKVWLLQDAAGAWSLRLVSTVTQDISKYPGYSVDIATGDFVNAGTATGCTFTPASSTATGAVAMTVTVTTCSTTGSNCTKSYG